MDTGELKEIEAAILDAVSIRQMVLGRVTEMLETLDSLGYKHTWYDRNNIESRGTTDPLRRMIGSIEPLEGKAVSNTRYVALAGVVVAKASGGFEFWGLIEGNELGDVMVRTMPDKDQFYFSAPKPDWNEAEKNHQEDSFQDSLARLAKKIISVANGIGPDVLRNKLGITFPKA